MLESTVDTKYGIVTGVDVYPANERESLQILRHLEKQQNALGFQFKSIALDRGYDTGAVHRGLELLGITGYIAPIEFPNTPQRKGFVYDESHNSFTCPAGKALNFLRIYCNQSTGKYMRCYKAERNDCLGCPQSGTCLTGSEKSRKILASSCYPAFYRGHSRAFSPAYYEMMRRRKIWSEGSFAALKREHNLRRIRKRGISNAYEECLLAAIAINLKRMVKACLGTDILPIAAGYLYFVCFICFIRATLST